MLMTDDNDFSNFLEERRYITIGGDAWFDPVDDIVYVPFDRAVINFTYEEFKQTCQLFNALLANLNAVRDSEVQDDVLADSDDVLTTTQTDTIDDKDYN